MPIRTLILATLLALPALQALAQYKVVRPDGSITYTDRPPLTEQNVRVTPMGRATAGPASPEAALPAELRTAMQRYPVTLYTSSDCGSPCDGGRRLLQQRGIPYSERRVESNEDTLALERVSGGRTVPALTIGAQQLRGLSDADWNSYLDAAGYPRESKLPRNWAQAAPLPLVDRNAASAPARSTPPVDPRPNDLPVVNQPEGVRF
jgi:glutaredoxin